MELLLLFTHTRGDLQPIYTYKGGTTTFIYAYMRGNYCLFKHTYCTHSHTERNMSFTHTRGELVIYTCKGGTFHLHIQGEELLICTYSGWGTARLIYTNIMGGTHTHG